MAVLLDNPVRSYAWGSTSVIPELLGREPSGEPQAELWIGAHPGAPSVVEGDGRGLDEVIAADPASNLGAGVVERFGPALPFLLKVLAVGAPLSIQVHPTIAQAEAGFAAEDAAGVPIDAPERNYRDRNHKPEMVVALTDFEGLLGFRAPDETAALLARFTVAELTAAADTVRSHDGLATLTRAWLTMPAGHAEALVGSLVEAAPRVDDGLGALVGRLGRAFPGDRGILLALLLRHVRLRPGQAAFVPAGVPHVYLGGVAVEPQASSDNTLRAGLTPKHVDVAEVLRLLRYEPDGAVMIEPVGDASRVDYPVPGMAEFALSRLDLSGTQAQVDGGPRIVLVTEGRVEVGTAGAEGTAGETGQVVPVERGRAAFVAASEGVATVTGTGTAFVITTGTDTAR